MNIKPLHDKVLIAEGKKDTTTESGIIVGQDHSQAQTATVLAKGPDAGDAVNIGDKVILDYSKAWQVKYEGKTYHFLEPKFVIATA